MSRLPLVKPHRREHTYCAFCPKLSRSSCPVSTVQGRETTTPWGKMTSLHHVDEGNLPLSREHAGVWWACTGCRRCKSFCEHGNEVADALNAGRAEAVRAGVAPAAAYSVIERHPERERRAKDAAERLFGDRLRRPARTVVVPGCTACTIADDVATDAVRATEALTGGAPRVEASRCCGLPLLEAGDRDGFLASATRFLEALSGAEDVVFADPGCLHALAVTAPRLGLPHEVPMRHLSELAASALSRLGRVELRGPVRWKDPCRLGRGLGLYEPPRAVLAQAIGRAPDEYHQNRALAECSGAGGQLPRTDRASADAIARERIAGDSHKPIGTLVTSCAASVSILRKQKPAFEVLDLATVLARALDAGAAGRPGGTT